MIIDKPGNLQARMTDTIFALSTPPGKSGVAVIRVSGPHAAGTVEIFGVNTLPPPRKAQVSTLHLKDGTVLDRALIIYFTAPHSFTGEDTVEYHIHGSRAVIARTLSELGGIATLRPAEPGEFTRRAFFYGKMDLTAAEGLADLIDAETESQRRQALRIMQGHAAGFYDFLRAGILESLALYEAYIDFPDEEIPESAVLDSHAHVVSLMNIINIQLKNSGFAERIRDGVRVAIIGPPNAGKSTLMNHLARRDVAIVSETAGTTRDVIEVHLDINGYAVIIADTAGLRETENSIEMEGIRRTLARAADADMCIFVVDEASLNAVENDPAIRSFIHKDTVVVWNKADIALPALPTLLGIIPIIASARDGRGMEALLGEIEKRLAIYSSAESSFITRARHRHHLNVALMHLQTFTALENIGMELKCEELRRAATEIGRITGVIVADEVLGQIFGRFCIGK